MIMFGIKGDRWYTKTTMPICGVFLVIAYIAVSNIDDGGRFVQVPSTEEEWLSLSKQFQERWNFPNCLGAMDRKHVVMVQPSHSGSHYRNNKGSDGIVLLAVVG